MEDDQINIAEDQEPQDPQGIVPLDVNVNVLPTGDTDDIDIAADDQGQDINVFPVPLDARESVDVLRTGVNFADTLNYLRGAGGVGLSADQKNAFFHLSLGVGLSEAQSRFHPSVGVDPCSFLTTTSIANVARIFDDPPSASGTPVVSADPALINPVARGPRVLSFAPRATAPATTVPIPDYATMLMDRLDRMEKQLDAANRMNKSTFLSEEGSDFLIPPPKLGKSGSAASAVKALKVLISTEKYSLDDANCTPLRNLLPLVAGIIEQHKLNEYNAYFCVLNILKGDLSVVLSDLMNEKRPFAEAWRHIQLMAQGTYSRADVEKDIKKLVNTRPSSVSLTFSRLQLLYKKLYQYIMDPVKRATIVNTKVVEDIFKIISTFYPSSYSQIENMMETRRNMATEDFDEVGVLAEVAVSYINRRQVNLGAETVHMNPYVVEAQFAPMVAQPLIASSPAIPVQQYQVHQPQPQQQQQYQIQQQPPSQQPQQQQQQQPFHQQQQGQRFNGFKSQKNGYNNQRGYQQNNNSEGQQMNQDNRQRGQQGQQRRFNPNQDSQQQQGQQGQGQNGPFRMDIEQGNCFKCNRPNHWAGECRTYAQQTCRRKCIYCGGYHSEACKKQFNQNNRSNGGNQSRYDDVNGFHNRNNGNQGSNPAPPARGAIGSGQALPAAAYLAPMNTQEGNHN